MNTKTILFGRYAFWLAAAPLVLSQSVRAQVTNIWTNTYPSCFFNPCGNTGANFGAALAPVGVGGVAVGAPQWTLYDTFGIPPRPAGPGAGTVSLLDQTGQTATSTGPSYFSPNGISPGQFGEALAGLPDGTVLAGAPTTASSLTSSNGLIYLLSTNAQVLTQWTNPAGSSAANTFFGHTLLTLPGGLFAAGSVQGFGRVFLFTNSQPTPALVITNPNPTALPAGSPNPWSGRFGTALATLGSDRMLIGSPLDSVGGDLAGSVFIYTLTGNRLLPIHNPTGQRDLFGSSVLAVDSHTFLIGAPATKITYFSGGQLFTNQTGGAVYLYDDIGTLLRTFTNASPSLSGSFGAALSPLGAGRVLIGAPGDKFGTFANVGAVHLFNTAGIHLATIVCPSETTGAAFGSSVVALNGHVFAVGAPHDSIGGSVYAFDAPLVSIQLGAEIVRPPNVDGTALPPAQGPAVSPPGAAFWHVLSQKLFAVQPGAILVTWPLLGGQTYNLQATVSWPTNNSQFQLHVAGPTPVDMTSAGAYSNIVLEATTTDADPGGVSSNRAFSAQIPGMSLLMVSAGNPSSNAIRFQLVRSIAWNDPAHLYDNAPATIGQPIADPANFHDPAAGSPQVVVTSGAYCPPPAFNPLTRTGTIIPVNQRDPTTPSHDLVVAFYQRGSLLYDPVTSQAVSNNIFWPYQPARFLPQWPTNAQHLVIASSQGTGVIDPTQFVNWQLYFQNDPTQPGFNPNDEHALRLPSGSGFAVFALRNDLGTPQTSQPFVMILYQDPVSGGQFRMKLWQVVTQEAPSLFNYPALAGSLLQPQFAISALPPSAQTVGVSGPYWQDRKGFFWAKAAGDNGGTADIVMHYFYPMQSSFFYPGTNPPPTGASVPLLDIAAGTPGTPIDVHFSATWPTGIPTLSPGETLVTAKHGLPDIRSQSSVQIIYQQAQALGQGTSVKLIDPTREYDVPLAQAPAGVDNNGFFPALPPSLRGRFMWDSQAGLLRFKGQFIQPPLGEYYLLLNVLTSRDLNTILSLSSDATFQAAVNNLAALVPTATEIPPNAMNYDSMALTAGQAQGLGYVTLAFDDSSNLPPALLSEPISLAVIDVACPPYRGQVEVLESPDPFDETLTLRSSGDFAGQTGSYIFDWRTLPPNADGSVPTNPPDQWPSFQTVPASGQGAVDITIQGPGPFTLSDNFFRFRYRPVSTPLCSSPTNTLGWSDWTDPMIAPGWISRVLAGINPFDQRVSSYANSQVNTIVSMISQAGPPYTGPVALNQQNANQFGLIQTYETVLRRGESLSIDAGINYGPANDELLRVAGQLSDLYMVLGNEAYADAEDPTIAFGTDNQTYGPQATSIHCFQGQTDSLMEEELDLLRGRDDTKLPSVHTQPVYNRLIWNFTQGVDGGEVAYALNYNIRAANGSVSGTISAADAQALYPQGHGDAWGHYLSAIKHYYKLLRNPSFTWVPAIDTVLVGGAPVSVGFEHERKFAVAAAARARTGAEVVNLTYRNAYVEDPAGQWQGYTDPNTNRAWGLAEWGSRAGQGAFFDWVTANALLPAVDSDPTHTGIQKIDRTTVTEIRDITSALGDIQAKVDQADRGLNPLGLAKNVVPFDIDPNLIAQGQTHFEQIYGRAVTALNNAIGVFNRANNCTQVLRQQADTVSDFQTKVTNQEADFNSRLIEIFGYPYAEDIGPGGSYPSGYSGPDLYHYDYVDESAITGDTDPPTQTLNVNLFSLNVGSDGSLIASPQTVQYNLSTQALGLVKPGGWTSRQAPGQIQLARSDFLQGYARFQKALSDYDNLIQQVEDRASLLALQQNVAANQILIMNQNLQTQEGLDQQIAESKINEQQWQLAGSVTLRLADATAEALPKQEGLSVDLFAAIRGAIKGVAAITAMAFEGEAGAEQISQLVFQQDKEIASLQQQIDITTAQNQVVLASDLQQLQQLVLQESSTRLELFNAGEALQQLSGRYNSSLASGERLLEDRLRFRQQTAAQIQQYRYKDMAFRIFRNDALQKYRAQFDLAAMYVYLAARAYDYETNLKKGDPRGPGSDFMTSIVRAQALGIIQNGLPQTGPATGDAGLADPMARMNLNWQLVLKGQLGFNNPQTETGRFSLRSELFRVQAGFGGSQTWRTTLTQCIVDNLLTMPEFKRFCIPFQPRLPVEPAIVIPFGTTINFGQNFFAWPLAGGDNNYDSTHFATKVRSVGVWFANYNNVALASTPHVYLIPVGADVMRSPSLNVGDIRQWKVLDQALPVPFPLTTTSLNDPTWIPTDSLAEQMAQIRLYPEFRAYTDSGTFDPTQVISNYRLIGRSVWNTRWLLIIPAGELLSDRNEGLQRFINGALLPNGTRDGNGVTDIKIFFQTYAYSGT